MIVRLVALAAVAVVSFFAGYGFGVLAMADTDSSWPVDESDEAGA